MICTHVNIYPVKLAVSLLHWIAFFPLSAGDAEFSGAVDAATDAT